ncbi:MAG: hypothetical protein K2N38_12845 [Oscillospiraceae bacterium]|nr:hypothetical protein [Oscillospiraceae bacterium]
MKGILYGNFLLNKKWFIAAGITAVLGTAFCAFFVSLVPDEAGVVATLFFGMQMVVMAIIVEWLGRNLEANIKCRFADITLAGGISKNTFVMSELLKNFITIVIGFVMCVMMQLVMSVFDKSFFSLDTVKMTALLIVFMGAIEWTVNPLVINFKSAEKAGLVMGLILAFGVVIPLMIISNAFAEETADFVSAFFKLLSGNWMPLIIFGISAALYAIFYLALLARVKKGDVC